MGNKLTKSSAILMTALTLGASTISTTQAVFAETGVVKAAEAEVNNADYKVSIKGFNLNNVYNATNKSIRGTVPRFGLGLTIPDGSKVKKGDKVTLNFQNYRILPGDILDKSGRKIATVKRVSGTEPQIDLMAGNEPVWQKTTIETGSHTQVVEIVFEDISDLKNIDASFESQVIQQPAFNEKDVVLPINVKDATGKVLGEDKAFITGVTPIIDTPTYVKGSAHKVAYTDVQVWDMNVQKGSNILTLSNIKHSWMPDKLKKGTQFEWNFNDPNFNTVIKSLRGTIDGKDIDLNQNIVGKVITAQPPLAAIDNKAFTKANKDGFLLAKPFVPKYIVKELTGDKLVIELVEDVPADATLQFLSIAYVDVTPKKIDDTIIDPKTGNLLVNATYKLGYKNVATGVEEKYDYTPRIVNQGTWSNATGQIVKKSSTQLIGRIPGGKEVPITNTDPMEPGTPFSLTPKPIIVVDGKSYKPVDPKPVTGKTDPNVPKVFTNYEEVLPPTTTQKADPATTAVTTSAPTTKAPITTAKPVTTTVTTKAPKKVTTYFKGPSGKDLVPLTEGDKPKVDIPGYTYTGTTTDPNGNVVHNYKPTPKKVTTYFKDPSGKDIVPPTEGDKPKVDIPGYTYTGTTTDPDGNIIHNYKPTPKDAVAPKKVKTYFKDDKGNEVKPPVDGDQPKLDIPGYEYVGTETDPDGNIIHKYKKVETKESKPLPKTGDASSLVGLIGTGLASVIGLVNFKRKK